VSRNLNNLYFFYKSQFMLSATRKQNICSQKSPLKCGHKIEDAIALSNGHSAYFLYGQLFKEESKVRHSDKNVPLDSCHLFKSMF